MSLVVEPAALAGFARQLDRATDDAEAIKKYVGGYSNDVTGGELFTIARQGHEHATGELQATLGRLIDVLDESARETTAAHTYYRRTDLAAADAIDRTLPMVSDRCPTALTYEIEALSCPPAPFSDPRQVTGNLAAPPAAETPMNPLGWMDLLSPTSWAVAGIEAVLGFNPISWLQEKFVGDWEALAIMQPALSRISTALHDLALNVQAGTIALTPHWKGNAADAAQRYFTDLTTGIAELETPIEEIGDAYKVMADAVWSAGQALDGIVKGILDAAIIAGIAAAAGTVTASTGVGAIVGYGVAAVEIANILRLWGQATKVYQHASAAVLAFRSALSRKCSDLESVTLPQLPGTGYDHPLVGADPTEVRYG